MIEKLLSTSDLAKLLGVCNRQVRRLVIEERVPAPIYIGRLPRWRESDVAFWVLAGCPDAEVFAAMQGKAVSA